MIDRIVIENYKSIRKIDFELKPINIFIGANGAGKSNFLSFFELLKNLFQGNLAFYLGNNINSFLYFGRKSSKYIYALVDLDNKNATHFYIAPSFHSNTGYIRELGVRVNPNGKKEYSDWPLVYEEKEYPESRLYSLEDPAGAEILDHFDNFRIHHFQDVTESARIKLPSKINDNRYLRENGGNLAAFLYFLQEKHPKEFKSIERQIHSVAPFFDRFDLEPDRLNTEQVELRWREKGSSDDFSAFDISDGTLRFIALTTLFLQPDLPRTIIIDEPELGLHPFAINKLAAMIEQATKKGSQIIISTQSIELINNFGPEDVIAVDREDNQSVFKRLEPEKLEAWLEDYTLGELWSKNLLGAMP